MRCAAVLAPFFVLLAVKLISSESVRAGEPDLTGFAIPIARICNACTRAQILEKAKLGGPGDRYFYDLINNQMHHIVTTCRQGEACSTADGPVSAGTSTAFTTYRRRWLENAASEAFHLEILVSLPSGRPKGNGRERTDNSKINAFDAITSSANDDDVIRYLINPAHFAGRDAEVLQLVVPIARPPIYFEQLTIGVRVTFDDRSARAYLFDKSLGRFSGISWTAQDASGNELPESRPPIVRRYLFGADRARNDYDERNLRALLPSGPAKWPAQGCAEARWDGRNLECVVAESPD
jgi:hypothetical protein